MPAIYNNGGVIFTAQNDPASTTLTVGANVNLLVLAVQHASGGSNTVGVPTFNGTAMTELDAVVAGGAGEMALYALEEPDIGTFSLVLPVSLYGAVKVMWSTWEGATIGASTGTPFKTTGTSNTPSSGSQTCPAGAALFAALSHNYSSGAATISAGTNIQSAYDGSAGRPFAAARRTDTGAFTWTTSDSNPWGVIGVAILGTASGVTPPTIGTQPTNQTVTAPAAATFSVTASGTGLTYQWRRNGVDISGATSASYTTPATVFATDNGALYSVVVSNAGGSVTSSNATLVVNPTADGTAPTLSGTITITALSSTGYTATCPVATDTVGVTGYQWRIGTSGGWTSIPAGGRTATITGRTPSTTDTFQMRAFDAAGNFSTPLSATVNLPAGTVTYAFTSESMFFATDTGPQLGRAVTYALYYGVAATQAGIASLPSATPVIGTGTTSLTDGTLRVTGLAASGQALMLAIDADGGAYLQSVTVA
jgi:beta-galactosidase